MKFPKEVKHRRLIYDKGLGVYKVVINGMPESYWPIVFTDRWLYSIKGDQREKVQKVIAKYVI